MFIYDFILHQQSVTHTVLLRPKMNVRMGGTEVLIPMKKRVKKKIDINIKSGHVWEKQRSAKCSI